MADNDILILLKMSLDISATSRDPLLLALIGEAKRAISEEGIALDYCNDDGTLIAMYAEYLYRQREEGKEMPRQLRWMLTNHLLHQKAKVEG